MTQAEDVSIYHPCSPYEGDMLYRFNTDMQRWEFWDWDVGEWFRSTIKSDKRPLYRVTSYELTWAEPMGEF